MNSKMDVTKGRGMNLGAYWGRAPRGGDIGRRDHFCVHPRKLIEVDDLARLGIDLVTFLIILVLGVILLALDLHKSSKDICQPQTICHTMCPSMRKIQIISSCATSHFSGHAGIHECICVFTAL
jgi:hypothetical protein